MWLLNVEPMLQIWLWRLNILVKNDSYTGHDAGIKEIYIELVPILKVELYS